LPTGAIKCDAEAGCEKGLGEIDELLGLWRHLDLAGGSIDLAIGDLLEQVFVGEFDKLDL
jgi:hypothetical protein